MDDYCAFTFEGNEGSGTYYVPCDRVGDINESLVNISSSTITCYSSIYGNYYDKRIQLPALAQPRYSASNTSTVTLITSVTSLTWNDRAQYLRNFERYKGFETVLLMVCIFGCILNLVRKR